MPIQADLKIGELGRGLFAQEDFGRGDVVLSVPLDVCIIRQLDAKDAMAGESETRLSDRDEEQKGGQDVKLSEAERKSMLWVVELFLSAELLSELFGQGSPPGFWQKYASLLPPPDTPFPLLLPKEQLEALRAVDSDLIQTVDSHRKKLKEGWEKQLGGECPPPLLWVNSCVLSRCFHIWSNSSVMAWLAPFIDMVNHAYDSNCSLQTSDAALLIVAKQAISKGDEITFSYAHFPNSHFYFRYGFSIPENESDSLVLPANLKGLHRGRWARFLREKCDILRSTPRRACLAATLPSEGEREDEDAEEAVDVREEMARAGGVGKWAEEQAALCVQFLDKGEHSQEARGYVQERQQLLAECVALTSMYTSFLEQA